MGVESWRDSSLSYSAEASCRYPKDSAASCVCRLLAVCRLDWSDAMGNWTYRFAVDMSTPTGSVGLAIGVSLASETSGEFGASQVILASDSSLAPAPG